MFLGVALSLSAEESNNLMRSSDKETQQASSEMEILLAENALLKSEYARLKAEYMCLKLKIELTVALNESAKSLCIFLKENPTALKLLRCNFDIVFRKDYRSLFYLLNDISLGG